jgi:transglutaminase-like putative cysteine protease
MHFTARHTTRYRYTAPVRCEPLTIRLKPRTDFRQRLVRYSLNIDPPPAGVSPAIDWEGNEATVAWFEGPLDELTIMTSFEAETCDVNPFDFLVAPTATRLPLLPAAQDAPFFALYANRADREAELEEWVQQLARDAEFDTLRFICNVNTWIHDHHEKIVRHDGAAWHPRKTLQQGCGSCRDLAVLFIEACRAMNIPSRFVSGYGLSLDESTDQEMHAWAEVYLPGAGWRPFDPSLGLAITDRHLTAAVGVTSENAAPTSGIYRGSAESRLQAHIELVATPATTAMVQIQSS